MKTLTTLLCTLFIFTATYSQELETLGAGVIDFLLTNPKTANRTNATESAALNVLGDLLSITAHRKHHMNVAKAGRSEIVINTNSGNNATVYSDTKGNVYILYSGTIYPISAGLVNQAKTVQPDIKNSTLPAYDYSALQKEYMFERTITQVEYFLQKKKETLQEIAPRSTHDAKPVFWAFKCALTAASFFAVGLPAIGNRGIHCLTTERDFEETRQRTGPPIRPQASPLAKR